MHTTKNDKSSNYLPDESSTSEETSLHRKDAEMLVKKFDFSHSNLSFSDRFRVKKDSNTSSISTEQRQSGKIEDRKLNSFFEKIVFLFRCIDIGCK